MPIKFRCPHCRQFLGISRSKAGEVADCPMCGKTLRVPDLDGSIKPLPKPKMNLQDSSLVDALGELASIGSAASIDATIDSDEDGPPGSAAPAVVSTPEPIRLEPLAPAKAIALADQPKARQRVARAGRSERVAEASESDDALAALSAQASVSAMAETVPARRQLASRSSMLIAGAVVLFVIGGLGLAAMMSGFRSTDDSDPPSPDAPDAADVAGSDEAVINPGGPPAITGRITYLSDDGDSRPDDGAKILALPLERRGTIKFDVAGFLVGSEDFDTQVAAASLRALGGDLATADDQGHYAIRLPKAGGYKLLVISRHQSRPWEIGAEDDVQTLLARFFIRYQTLLGQLAYNVQDFQYRGQGSSPRDVAFERE